METILVVGVIALPILIYLIKFGWPQIKTYFTTGMTNLDQAPTTRRTIARNPFAIWRPTAIWWPDGVAGRGLLVGGHDHRSLATQNI